MHKKFHIARLHKTHGEFARSARVARYKYAGNLTLGFVGVYLAGNGIKEFASGHGGWGMIVSTAIGGAMIGDGFPRAVQHGVEYRKLNNEAQALAVLIEKVENTGNSIQPLSENEDPSQAT